MKITFEKVPLGLDASFACREFTAPIFDCPYHYHPEYEITLILRGSGARLVGNHVDHFEAGDIVILGENLPHMYYSEPQNILRDQWAHSRTIQFKADCLGTGFFDRPEMRLIRKMLIHSQQGLYFPKSMTPAITEHIAGVFKARDTLRIIAFLELLHFLATRGGGIALLNAVLEAKFDFAQSDRINRVFEYIWAHFEEPLSQQEAAAQIGMSPPAFSRFFRRTCRMTFSEFLTQVRLAHACHLLREKDSTIAEICFACGFSNLANFNRRFKEHFKQTPRTYRTFTRRLHEQTTSLLSEQPSRLRQRNFP